MKIVVVGFRCDGQRFSKYAVELFYSLFWRAWQRFLAISPPGERIPKRQYRKARTLSGAGSP